MDIFQIPMANRTRNWCATLNNWTDEELAHICSKADECKYAIIGKEKGAEGTPHLQMYLSFRSYKSFDAVGKIVGPRAHLEPARGDPLSNFKYCSKDGDFIEIGTRPSGKGKRNDLEEVKEILAAGGGLKRVIDRTSSLPAIKYAKEIQPYMERKRTEKPTVIWIYGRSGIGKTRKAIELCQDSPYWISHGSLQWFDGYDGEEIVLFDDFRESHCKFEYLLRLLDRYPMMVPIKGGFRQWRPDVIFVTSRWHPCMCFDLKGKDDPEQLTRRCDDIIHYVDGALGIVEEVDKGNSLARFGLSGVAAAFPARMRQLAAAAASSSPVAGLAPISPPSIVDLTQDSGDDDE